MCIKNESTGKYGCSHAPYTRFTSVIWLWMIVNKDCEAAGKEET